MKIFCIFITLIVSIMDSKEILNVPKTDESHLLDAGYKPSVVGTPYLKPMETKACMVCGVTHPLSEFRKRKVGNPLNKCKYCEKEYQKEYAIKNKEDVSEYNKKYREKNLKKMLAYTKNYYQEHKEESKAYQKEYKKKNKATIQAKVRVFNSLHRDKLNKKKRVYFKNRREKDPGFRMLVNLRRRLILALKGERKSETTRRLLGCDNETLINHFEAQFTSEMSWSNYGKFWSIDHIIPCDAFDLTDPEQQKICFHYTNLQPLPIKDNRGKSNSIPIIL